MSDRPEFGSFPSEKSYVKEELDNSEKVSAAPSAFVLRETFQKYALVWLWSIAFGSATGLLYSSLSLSSVGRFGLLAIAPATVAVYSFLFIGKALTQLLTVLKTIGKFITAENMQKRELDLASARLLGSFRLIVYAAFFRFLVEIVVGVLNGLSRF